MQQKDNKKSPQAETCGDSDLSPSGIFLLSVVQIESYLFSMSSFLEYSY